jgi:hypothetical protein
MPITIADLFKKIDELDTFLIESGCERTNDIEMVSYFRNGSEEETKVTLIVSEPNYKMREYSDD